VTESHEQALAEWHDWYASTLAQLRNLTLDDVVISWLAHVRPNVWRLAWPPYPAEQQQWPGPYLQPAVGEWWGPEGLAKSHATAVGKHLLTQGILVGEPGFYFGGQIGHLAKLNEVAVLHQRGWQVQGSLRLPVDPEATPHDEFIWRQVLARFRFALSGVSRRKGSTQTGPPPDWTGDPSGWIGPPRRSQAQRASVTRALLIAGLVFERVPHRKAIRAWLEWEVDLNGPTSGRESVRRAYGWLEDDLKLRDFEDRTAASDRQIWRSIGIEPRAGADS
jgi:hypothetical protein